MSYAVDMFREQVDEESTFIEAEILKALLEAKDHVEKGKIALKRIAETFNVERPENEKWHTQTVSKYVRQLGLKGCRMSNGCTGFYWDDKRVEALRDRFLPQAPSSSSDPSDSSESIAEYNGKAIVAVKSLDQPHEDSCAKCTAKRVLSHCVTFTDGSWMDVCADCAEELVKNGRSTAK